ncbi:hypothetical protein OAA03_00355 [bacterium]|nr:hypothetical protein [bacterium]
MYLTPSYTIQFPEIKKVIGNYYSKIYDHDSLIKDRHNIQDRFIENFISWFNKGHFKVKGLRDFKHVYITNGVSEAINMAMTEHSLRPEVVTDDYPGYIAQYLMLRKAGIALTNRIPFISLPFYDTADEHPQTETILEENAFVDLAWAGGSGLKKTYDLSKVGYVAFSFSKMFGIQYHRVGILFSKKPINTLEMFKKEAYVNLAGVDLINQLMSFSPSYFYDKYRCQADEICKRLNLETTPSLWFGRKNNKKVPLLDEWLKI